MVKDIHDVITHAKFGDYRLRGSGVVAGQISAFSVDIAGRPYNTLTLPCERMIQLLNARRCFGITDKWLKALCATSLLPLSSSAQKLHTYELFRNSSTLSFCVLQHITFSRCLPHTSADQSTHFPWHSQHFLLLEKYNDLYIRC